MALFPQRVCCRCWLPTQPFRKWRKSTWGPRRLQVLYPTGGLWTITDQFTTTARSLNEDLAVGYFRGGRLNRNTGQKIVDMWGVMCSLKYLYSSSLRCVCACVCVTLNKSLLQMLLKSKGLERVIYKVSLNVCWGGVFIGVQRFIFLHEFVYFCLHVTNKVSSKWAAVMSSIIPEFWLGSLSFT